MTTGFDLDEIERLLAAATVGEWAVGEDGGMPFPEITLAGSPFELASFTAGEEGDENMANAALTVALHNSAPAMIAEIREMRAENARFKWWQDEVLKLQSDHYGNGVMTHLRLSEFCDDARAMRALAALGEPQ